MESSLLNSHNMCTETELKVGHVWMTVLGSEAQFPSTTTTFVQLGGDSVSALLCVSRLRNVFGPDLDIDLSDFFTERSTIQNFAKSIDDANSTEV